MDHGDIRRRRHAANRLLAVLIASTAVLGLGACAGEDEAATPAEWYDHDGEAWFGDFVTVVNRGDTIGTDLEAGSVWCHELDEMAKRAVDLPDIPDDDLEGYWQIAASNLSSAATSCQSGIERRDPAYLRMSAELALAAGNRLCELASQMGGNPTL